MRIAIPTANGLLNMHFGHCQAFTVIDVDTGTKKVLKSTDLPAPPHEPGLLPRFLGEHGVNVVIAGGMGMQAQNLFEGQGIAVIVGAPAKTPAELVEDYLAGRLVSGQNVCDH